MKNRNQMNNLMLSGLLALSLVSCKQQTAAPTSGDYKTLTVTTTDRTTHSSYSASIQGKQDVEIYPQVSGLITKVVKSAEASVATAQMTADSKAKLYKDGIISDFDLTSARNALRQQKAVLAQARAELTNARNNLSYTEVKSPVDGAAGMIPYRIGALVGPSITTPLVTVSDNNEMYAYFSMTEKQMLYLTGQYGSTDNDMKAMSGLGLVLNDGSTYAEKGNVDAISGIIDPKTGAVSIRAVFPNPNRVLRSGGAANVLMPYVKKGCIVIPQEATFELQDKIFIYKIVDGKTKSAAITVFPISDGKEYIVESGIKTGDIIIAEGAGLLRANLPMEQYPDIAPPTIQVSATYTGASAETVQKSVIVPLEESINGVEDMTYMTSSATNTGNATINVYFKQGTDPDMAAVNVQNRVTKAQGTLPSEVTKIGVTAEKRQNSQLKLMSLYSKDDTYDETFLANYLKINIVPRIQRITGVGEVMVMGNDYAMRIWLKPDVMAQYGLVPADIVSVLGEQNIEASTGTLGEDSENIFQYTLKYRGRYETSDEYGELVVRTTENGNVLRLKDVADIELGTSSYNFTGGVSGHPGATFMVTQTAGSNANEIIEAIDEMTEEIRAELPEGLVLEDMMSVKDFLDVSIDSVIRTLLEAILLVIIVVYVFLQSVRSTFIPLAGIIVSLVGTFAFLYVAGFSINLLTLFALVLVIGTVVDDSIVVVEAVQAKFDEGYKSPYKATVDAMGGITSAIITTTLVFMAVFIPVSFMGGTTGTFYTQFGLTMAVAVGISALNALTLSPALCALIMTPHTRAEDGRKLSFSSRFHIAFDAAFNRMLTKYKTAVKFFFRRKWVVGVALAAASVLLVVLMKTTKTGLIPDEDTGTVFVSVTAAPGSTLNETKQVMAQVEKRLNDIPQIDLFSTVCGYNLMDGGQSSTAGTFIVRLKHWDERKGKENGKDAVIQQIFARTADIKNAQVFAFAPPMIMGYGTSNGLEIYVQDCKGGDIETLFSHTQKFVAALNERPEIQSALTTFDTRFPQYLVEVDAECRPRM